MKKIKLVQLSALALALSANTAMAAEKPSDVDAFIDGLDKNLSITSNYVWRGISQGGSLPAVQGGATYNHDSGVSVDLWLSSSAGGSNEYDLTVSYAMQKKDLGLEFGLVSYTYPQDGATDTSRELFAGVNVNNMNAYIYINGDSASGDNIYIELSADINRFNVALGINSNDFDALSYNQITTTVALADNLNFSWSETDQDGVRGELALTYNIPLN